MGSQFPLVTVAMVTFNSEQFIAQAIESVLASSYTNFELLICDDASSDSTWDIVQSYEDARIRTTRNLCNIGEYANRNQAIQLAKGEYLMYIDGDDVLYPHGLELIVRMLDAFPSCAMALAKQWAPHLIYPIELTSRQFYSCQFLGRQVQAASFCHLLFRTQALRESGGFDLRYQMGDSYIQYRLALTHNCLLTNDSVAWWRQRPGQASEMVIKDHQGWPRSLEFIRAFLNDPRCPLQKREIELALSNTYGTYIRVALRYALRGRVAHAWWLLRNAHLPLLAWKFAMVPGRYPYLASANGSRPLFVPLARNPFARISNTSPQRANTMFQARHQ